MCTSFCFNALLVAEWPQILPFTCTHVANSTSQLSISDLGTVMTRLCPACSKWFLIGCLLGIEVGTLEAIRKDYRDISMECLVALLTTWLRRTSPKPTWKALVDVLKSPPVGVQVNLET